MALYLQLVSIVLYTNAAANMELAAERFANRGLTEQVKFFDDFCGKDEFQLRLIMDTEQWSRRNQFLNSLQKAIEKQTYGRLTDVVLVCVDNEIVVYANSAAYYDVQLAICAIRKFTSEFPHDLRTQLNVNIDGHAISLKDTCARTSSDLSQNQTRALLSTRSQTGLSDSLELNTMTLVLS